ncbi:hypothetical protein Hamer_G000664, partial [Homarus americanus]
MAGMRMKRQQTAAMAFMEECEADTDTDVVQYPPPLCSRDEETTEDIQVGKVKDAPFEMGNQIIMNIISKYGKVERVRLNKYTKGPAAGLLNGTRTFKRKTYYKCGYEFHLEIDCHTEEVGKVKIFNEEDFPAIQLSGEIQSAMADVNEGEESVT